MRAIALAAVFVVTGPLMAQSGSPESLAEALTSGQADPASFDYGAVYFAEHAEDAWASIRSHLEAIGSDRHDDEHDEGEWGRELCRSTAIVYGMQAAERAEDAEAYRADYRQAMSWYAELEARGESEVARLTAAADSALHAEIASRQTWDQAWRFGLSDVMSGEAGLTGQGQQIGMSLMLVRMCETDIDNLAFLRDYLAANGWPRISEHGEAVDNAVWLMLQHAPAAEQEAWLPELERLYRRGETNPRNYALLYDRVMMNRGEPQRYGSQYVCNDGGPYEMYTLEDPDGVDERRRAMGMNTVEENGRRFEQLTCPAGN